MKIGMSSDALSHIALKTIYAHQTSNYVDDVLDGFRYLTIPSNPLEHNIVGNCGAGVHGCAKDRPVSLILAIHVVCAYLLQSENPH